VQSNSEITENPPARTRKKSAVRLSKDGKWRSFPRVPHLLQYVSSSTYFARIKIGGVIHRESLETTVWTDAQLRLVDFLKEKQSKQDAMDDVQVSFADATELYKQRVENDHAMKKRSKGYRRLCIRKIESSWPGVTKRFLGEITEAECREWAVGLQEGIASQYFNNVIGTLRLIIEEGIKEQKRRGGKAIENPAADLSRAKITQKVLQLPERDQFKAIVSTIRAGSSWGPKAANLVEFLAYGGMRLYTEAQWVNWEDVDWQRMEIIVRGQPDTATKNWEIRRIPILPDMESLLKRMQAEIPGQHTGKILEITECPVSLERACSKVGIPRITHHDLRHLFATRCIESGVDIPTVSHWLGHKDRGVLAMKTYGHLRNEHSKAMAAKVKF
jgi:integrase